MVLKVSMCNHKWSLTLGTHLRFPHLEIPSHPIIPSKYFLNLCISGRSRYGEEEVLPLPLYNLNPTNLVIQ
ncbi:hypothetical protein L3X38_044784 [Prunus dulcis]|uniref:Uncharacterized protein n=1 Tax=Prunus dulcis TaxID=3755 RepID=A0AAD4YP83_PRUDU|nr:hypothetical protein L3X38_044784 [Prunus dulcis]